MRDLSLSSVSIRRLRSLFGSLRYEFYDNIFFLASAKFAEYDVTNLQLSSLRSVLDLRLYSELTCELDG